MSKFKKIIFFILTIFYIFCLTGCKSKSSENLENYYYVMAISVDSSKNENINLGIQIATNSSNGDTSSGSSQSNSSSIYSVPCNSIDSGLSILNNYLSKKINLSHCAAIVFSENLAKKGIKKYVDSFAKNPDIRPTCSILVSNTTGLEALEKISNSSEIFSSKFYEFIQSSAQYTGYTLTPELSEFYYCLNFGSNSAIATYAYISNNSLQNTGIAIFNNDKMITNLSVLDSVSYSLISNRLETATISLKNPENPSELIDVSIKETKKPIIKCSLINEYPFIKINLTLEYNILNLPESLEINNFQINSIIENAINSYIEEIISSFLYNISHKYNSDICNFRNKFSSNYLTLDDFEKIHWDKIYKDSYFEINVNGIIRTSGLMSK